LSILGTRSLPGAPRTAAGNGADPAERRKTLLKGSELSGATGSGSCKEARLSPRGRQRKKAGIGLPDLAR